jgi:hypothetical protein
MTLHITIKLDNAAFEDLNCGHEVGRILRQLADMGDRELITPNVGLVTVLRDINGNSVGEAKIK